MNVPQTMVALLTLASEDEQVTEEMAEQTRAMLSDATPDETTVLVASLSNVLSYALTLLELRTGMSKSAFLAELAQDVAHKES